MPGRAGHRLPDTEAEPHLTLSVESSCGNDAEADLLLHIRRTRTGLPAVETPQGASCNIPHNVITVFYCEGVQIRNSPGICESFECLYGT